MLTKPYSKPGLIGKRINSILLLTMYSHWAETPGPLNKYLPFADLIKKSRFIEKIIYETNIPDNIDEFAPEQEGHGHLYKITVMPSKPDMDWLMNIK